MDGSSPSEEKPVLKASRFVANLLSCHNLVQPNTTAKMGQEDAVYLAKLAEQAERYEGVYLPYVPDLAIPLHLRR